MVPYLVSFFTSVAPTLCFVGLFGCMGKKVTGENVGGKRSKAAKGDGLDPKEATKMRNWLSYNADPTRSDAQNFEKAAAAKSVFEQCKTGRERKMFLESFAQDKNKDLKWVHCFKEKLQNVETHKEWGKRGYVTVPQALKENNMQLNDFNDHKEAEAFVREWWGENSEKYKTKEEYPVIEDKQNRPLWHKFYFIFPQLGEDSLATVDSKEFTGTGNVSTCKGLEWAANRMQGITDGQASGSSGPEIKLENALWPKIVEMKDQLAHRP